jgi:hypothetical protein
MPSKSEKHLRSFDQDDRQEYAIVETTYRTPQFEKNFFAFAASPGHQAEKYRLD